jgi:hypothetical protein
MVIVLHKAMGIMLWKIGNDTEKLKAAVFDEVADHNKDRTSLKGESVDC